HAVDDGLRADLFEAGQLVDEPLFGPILRDILDAHRNLDLGRLIGEAVRRVITIMVADVVSETRRRLDSARPQTAAAVRASPEAIAAFTPPMATELQQLKAFLNRRMY